MLVSLAASVIRQDDLRPMHGKMDWERLFRIADYNRIANLIYLGVLGNERVPQHWRECFFERYLESLRFGESCEEGERELLTLFDLREIPAVLMLSGNRRGLYERPEMAGEAGPCLYLDEEHYVLAKGYLVDLGYETDRHYGMGGEHMKKGSFSVELYKRLPYKTRRYQRWMARLLGETVGLYPYVQIRALPGASRLLYLFADAAYRYATQRLLVRDMLDLCLLHRSLRGDLDMEALWRRLRELRVEQLCRKLLGLAYMWFGTRQESAEYTEQDSLGDYDIIENRMLGYGKVYAEVMPEALALAAEILREEERENRRARVRLFLRDLQENWRRFRRKPNL